MKVDKAIEMSDVFIKFLSVVDKGANFREWIIAKDDSDTKQANIKINVPIIKSDETFGINVPEGSHLIVGPVYEPMVEDAHGNFMTESEITKAMNWFIDNGLGSDIQHNNVLFDGVNVVKCWQLTSDLETTDWKNNPVTIKKGAWMAGALVQDQELWTKIEKGDFTGWSMGGIGTYDTVDVDLIEKSMFQKIAELFGYKVDVKKAEVQEVFDDITRVENFWNAWYALLEVLYPFNMDTFEQDFVRDPELIQRSLEDFNNIVTDLLTNGDEVELSLVNKAGKKISSNNMTQIKSAYESLGNLINLVEGDEEELNGEDIKKAIQEVLTEQGLIKKEEEKPEPTIEELVAHAVEKAMLPLEEQRKDTENLSMEEQIANAVAKAMEPIYKSRGISQALDTEVVEEKETKEVKKSVFGGVIFPKK